MRFVSCTRGVFILGLTFGILIPMTEAGQYSSHAHAIMPVPASLAFDAGSLEIDSTFRVTLTGHTEPRLEKAVFRFIEHLSGQTGIPFRTAFLADTGGATLEISCEGSADPVQSPGENESYSIAITPRQARLTAPGPYGVMRGLETILQLVEADSLGFGIRCVRIKDAPRFPWRGLLIDVCRHWMPIEVMKRNLDAMAAVKMNVLHWHLSDDQGFRIESRQFPELNQKGSEGRYFTQDQVREVIAYAADRGIRVIPEFDMPGHTTSWFVSHPELASAPGPYDLAKTWGIFDAAMDPTREDVYSFIDRFIDEMSSLFPDPYFHIGGDEVTGRQWNDNPRIREFKRAKGMKSNQDLQAYFNRRILSILQKHGKKMIGWDEILHPDLPRDIVVQSWRSQKSLLDAAKGGYQGILSFGYYLDHMQPASFHYGIDPMGQDPAELNEAQKLNILGGEACIWAESVTPENVDSRIWPRCAAIAERLWSPADVKDVDDLYSRLEVVSRRLDGAGTTHRSGYMVMLERLANYGPVGPVKTLTDVVEPVKGYARIATHRYTVMTPLNRVVDAVRPESDVARRFGILVDQFLADSSHVRNSVTIKDMLSLWKDNHAQLLPCMQQSFLLKEIEPVSYNLSVVAGIGLDAFTALQNGSVIARDKRGQSMSLLESAAKPEAELLLMVLPSIRRLVSAASELTPH